MSKKSSFDDDRKKIGSVEKEEKFVRIQHFSFSTLQSFLLLSSRPSQQQQKQIAFNVKTPMIMHSIELGYENIYEMEEET